MAAAKGSYMLNEQICNPSTPFIQVSVSVLDLETYDSRHVFVINFKVIFIFLRILKLIRITIVYLLS